MSTTAIIINSTDAFGKAAQKAMTCVNPDATNAQLATLGQMITAAQNHTYGETYRINKVNCDLEASEPQKTTPTLSASITTFSASEFTTEGVNFKKSSSASILTYNGDGDFVVEKAAILGNLLFDVRTAEGKVIFFPFYNTNSAPTFPLTFNVGFTETETYKACSVEITVTA